MTRLVVIGALAVTAAGCAGVSLGPDAAGGPGSRQAIAAAHRARAEALERDGELCRALEAWKIALTVAPDEALRERRRRLEARIEGETAERLRLGREALAKNAHLEARRHFLAVLALSPGHRDALDALRNEVTDVRFVTHTVRPGETLSTIALRYYGDRSRADVIWEINQLPANPRLTVGASLRVPEIPGVPFVLTPGGAAAGAGPGAALREETPPEVNPLLADAREAFERREYVTALADVDKLLASTPRSAEGLELKKAILYGLGKGQLDGARYDESFQTLTHLARLAPDYEDATALLRVARERLVHQRYSDGLRLYSQEKLEEAIMAWRSVLELDPRHSSAARNIEQAEKVLRVLERRKK